MRESKAEYKDGQLIGWVCKWCNLYNDVLTSVCRDCNAYKPEWLTGEIQGIIAIRRGIFLNWKLDEPD